MHSVIYIIFEKELQLCICIPLLIFCLQKDWNSSQATIKFTDSLFIRSFNKYLLVGMHSYNKYYMPYLYYVL